MRGAVVWLLMGMFLQGIVPIARAQGTSHLVISQVQIAGATAHDEFVELYNPTTSPIDLATLPFHLHYRSSTGANSHKTLTLNKTNIGPLGYFLIAHTTYTGSIPPDATYTGTSGNLVSSGAAFISTSATKDAGTIDKVGWGLQGISGCESACALGGYDPIELNSFERKPGGERGNGQDTDNNFQDFLDPNISHPRNTFSPTVGGEGSSPAPLVASLPPLLAPGVVVINEFLPNPPEGQEEWVEIFSKTSRALDLAGWELIEGSGAVTPLSGSLSPGALLAFSSLKGALNNPGDHLILKDRDGRIIDEVSYGNFDDGTISDNTVVPARTASLARIPDGAITGNAKQDFLETTSPTKGLPNMLTLAEDKETSAHTVAASLKVAHILISEVLPNPQGDDAQGEFIELYNEDAVAVDITGWVLERRGGGRYVIQGVNSAQVVLAPKGFLAILRPQSHLALRNTGDTITLLHPQGSTVAVVTYQAPVQEGEAYAWDGVAWVWTARPTPGTANLIQKPNHAPELEWRIDATRGGQDLGRKAIRVGDDIILDASDTTDPDGDALSFTWEFMGHIYATPISKVRATREGRFVVKVTVRDAQGLEEHDEDDVLIRAALPPPRTRTTEKQDEELSVRVATAQHITALPKGSLVAVEGTVQKNQGSTWALQDTTGEVEITKAQDKRTALPAVKKGSKVKVTGRIARTSKGTRVVPRTNADIEVQEALEKEEGLTKDQETSLSVSQYTPQQLLPFVTASFAATGTLLAVLCALYGKELMVLVLRWFIKGFTR